MAKIYAKKYQKMIDDGEVTLAEAILLVNEQVPERWRDEVIALLHD